jgi:NAD-dependent DNA ligase
MAKTSDEKTQALLQQRDEAINDKNKSRQELLENMSNLSITQNRLQDALSKLEVLKPRPKEDVAAYHPDGHIISVDIQSNIVFIDIGSESKVYPGLTFAVYDRSAPIPTDGSSKGEIEIFDVSQNTATARIVNSSKRNPVAEGDIIINLIWDAKSVNRFVIAGDFDFNGDGRIDEDGRTKVAQLVENWGGKIEDTVTIDTDYVVLGNEPMPKKKQRLMMLKPIRWRMINTKLL